jgi:hypothetical protein
VFGSSARHGRVLLVALTPESTAALGAAQAGIERFPYRVGRHLGREVEAGFLVDGEGIHVRAQQDGRTGPGALERRHHRRQPIALPDAQAEAIERLQKGRLGPGQLEAQLRVAVDRAPEADHIRLQLLGFGKQCGDRHVSDATPGHQGPSTTATGRHAS